MSIIVVGPVDGAVPMSRDNISSFGMSDSIWYAFGDIFDEALKCKSNILSSVKSEEFTSQEVYSFHLLSGDDFILLIKYMRNFFNNFKDRETSRGLAALIWEEDIEPLLVKDYRYRVINS